MTAHRLSQFLCCTLAQTQPDPNPNPNPTPSPNPNPLRGSRSAGAVPRLRRVFLRGFPKNNRRPQPINHMVCRCFLRTDNANRCCLLRGGLISGTHYCRKIWALMVCVYVLQLLIASSQQFIIKDCVIQQSGFGIINTSV